VEQKDLFGASSGKLPYMECAPAGRSGPVSPECIKHRINTYPTWIISGQRYEGILKPAQLAALSGYTGSR